VRRILFAGVAALGALAIPTTVLVATSSPAGASSSLTCKKVSGSITGTTTISKCSVPKADKKTYKSASGNSTVLAGGGNITWKSSGATTSISAPTISSGTKCPAADSDVIATGSVTGGTATVTNAGDTFSGEFCITSKGKISVAKGTVVQL
jgi:hypothetical protein